MSRDANKIILTGRLGATPQAGAPDEPCLFRVASSYGEHTEWFQVVVWDGLGETCAAQLRKGMRVLVEGRLKSRRGTGAQTGRITGFEVVAGDVILIDDLGLYGLNGDERRLADQAESPAPLSPRPPADPQVAGGRPPQPGPRSPGALAARERQAGAASSWRMPEEQLPL